MDGKNKSGLEHWEGLGGGDLQKKSLGGAHGDKCKQTGYGKGAGSPRTS